MYLNCLYLKMSFVVKHSITNYTYYVYLQSSFLASRHTHTPTHTELTCKTYIDAHRNGGAAKNMYTLRLDKEGVIVYYNNIKTVNQASIHYVAHGYIDIMIYICKKAKINYYEWYYTTNENSSMTIKSYTYI